MLRHHERSGQVDADDGIPGIDRVFGDRGRGTGNAGIVDEHVQSSQMVLHILEKNAQIFGLADVTYSCTHGWVLLCDFLYRFAVDVGDVHLSTIGDKGIRNGQANSPCACGNEYALSHD